MSKTKEQELAILLSILDVGGNGTKKEVLDNILSSGYYSFSDSKLKDKENRKEAVWRNEFAYIKHKLHLNSYIDSGEYNNWAITESGIEYVINIADELSLGELTYLNIKALQKVNDFRECFINKEFEKHKKIDSWEISSNSVAFKKCDLSFFQYHGSGIPKDTAYFWNAESLKLGEKKYIQLYFKGAHYKAYLFKETNEDGRIRLFWYSDLSNEFKKLYPEYQEYAYEDYPQIRFTKREYNVYDAEFVESVIDEETNDNTDLETVIEVVSNSEGKKLAYFTTKYERNSQNRKNAIKLHGTKCMACGFDFQSFYGERGKDFIEVHHTKPLYDLNEEVMVNPETDLVCVCSNCHRIIHRKRDSILTLTELKDIISLNFPKQG